MTDKATPEILDFGGSISSSSTTPSHLSQIHSRPESSSRLDNYKRIKTNLEPTNKSFILTQVENTKDKLHHVIDLVLNGSSLEYSYNSYYKSVESLCRYKHIEQSKLSDILKSKLEEHFCHNVMPKIKAALKKEALNESVIEFLKVYEEWEGKLRLLSKLFLYLDRSYLLQHPQKKMILEYGLSLFVDELLADDKLTLSKHKLLLNKVREFEDVEDLKLAKRFSTTLIKLNFNNQIQLHNDLINSIVSHYNILKDNWLAEPENYIHLVFSKMSKEVTFFKECGHTNKFLKDLLLKLKWNLIFSNFNDIIKEVLPFLLQENNLKLLELFYSYCELSISEYQFDSISIFIYEWGQLAYKLFNESVENNKPTLKNIVPVLVDVYSKFNKIAIEKFGKNDKFEFELRNSFNRFLNQKSINSSIINQLCKYGDSYFKNLSKKLNTKELSFPDFQNNVLIIFKSLNNKNDFLIPYKKDLSRRLLLSRTVNITQEKKLVDSLLNLIGETDDAIGLQVMFKDLKTSKEKYSQVKDLDDKSIEFSAMVLEKKYWPEVPKKDTDIIMPEKLSSILDEFSTIYHKSQERFKDHNLDWSNYTLHQLAINANFELGPKELVVNLLQAIVILLFNERDVYDFNEILQLTNIDENLLKRILNTFSKYKILIQKESKFLYNSKFTDKSHRIRIPLSRDKEVPYSLDSDTANVIERNRSIEFRSAIVRIMKQFRTLTYAELLGKAIEMLEKNGPVTISDLKSAVDYSIGNEFVKRETKDRLAYIP